MSTNKKSLLKSILITVACLVGVFGGLFCIIHAEYVSAAAANGWYWAGGLLMGGFVLFFGIWFFAGGKRSS